MSTLTLVVCGAPLAARVEDLAVALQRDGWTVTQMPTSAAGAWVESPGTSERFRRPDEAKRPRPDAVVVCPMTFNTGNKWAAGVADTPPLSLLCEALGSQRPVVAVPFLKGTLWAHPAWEKSLRVLRDSGVRLVDPTDGGSTVRPVTSGSGQDTAVAFDPSWVVNLLRS